MKITKEKLNKIIKEEIEAVLSEEELSLWQKTKDFFDGRGKKRRERMANIDAAIASGEELTKLLSPGTSSGINNTNVLPVFDRALAWQQAVWPSTQVRMDVKPDDQSGLYKKNDGRLDRDLFDKAFKLYQVNEKLQRMINRWREGGGIKAAIEIAQSRKYPGRASTPYSLRNPEYKYGTGEQMPCSEARKIVADMYKEYGYPPPTYATPCKG